jgi:hypothetical protein
LPLTFLQRLALTRLQFAQLPEGTGKGKLSMMNTSPLANSSPSSTSALSSHQAKA